MNIHLKHHRKNISIHYESDADQSVIREIFTEHEYKVCDENIRKATNSIIDIGAHIGLFALYARTLNEKVPIFCYEPDESNYNLLKKNIKENKWKNIQTSNTAVAQSQGEVTLYIHEDSHNHSLIDSSKDSKKIHATTLERIFKKNRIEYCDLVKIDAEGAEFLIIPSLTDDVFARIGTFFIEYHQYNTTYQVQNIKSILKEKGFRVEDFPSHYDDRMGILYVRKS